MDNFHATYRITYIGLFFSVSCVNQTNTLKDSGHLFNGSHDTDACEFDTAPSQLDTYGIVSQLIPSVDAEASPRLVGVKVTECTSRNSTTTDDDGRYQLKVPDTDWIELEVFKSGSISSRWIYIPTYEGTITAPYINTLVGSNTLEDGGYAFDTDKAILVIDAILASDNNVSQDLHIASVQLQNPYEEKLPADDEHVFINVTPGLLMAEISAPPSYTCLPPPDINVRAGEVINLSLYCLSEE